MKDTDYSFLIEDGDTLGSRTIASHFVAFANLNKVIGDEVTETLKTIELMIKGGYTQDEVLAEFNKCWFSDKMESYAEMIEYLEDCGI